MSALELKVRRLAASLDAAALEALASKGLLRRAQKDVERGVAARIVGERATALLLQIGEFRVTMLESGPATATCSCPAAGVCQHILTAVLFLQQEASEHSQEHLAGVAVEQRPASSEKELMDITPEQLERWAGKATYKGGLKLAGQFTPEVVRERTIRIRYPAINSEVHFVPGGGLDGMIVSASKGDGRQLIVAAVIGFQRAQGREWAVPAELTALDASEGAPRTRAEVLVSCQTLLAETLDNGLSHLAAANQQRWATLAVSALGVNLPRLALTLRGIGDEAALVVARDARGDHARLLARMAQAHSLCSALQNCDDHPRADLVGLHRTRYDEVGHLDLVGVAAWPWRTASGYEGLTVLFRDSSANCWNSWTESRPRHQLADFKPVARYTQPGPWAGAESPQQLARHSFRLMNARRNPNRRLSASTRSRVLVTGPAPSQVHGLAGIKDWAQLQAVANAQTAIGLKELNPLDSIVAIRPEVWGDRGFNEVTQAFTWVVLDSQQSPLPLEIAFEEFTEPAIKYLEGASPESLRGALVIGRIQRRRGLSLHPFSLHLQNGEIVHLGLDAVQPLASGTAGDRTMDENGFDEEEEEAEAVAALSPLLGHLFDEVDDGLLALAEAGMAASNPLRVERLRQAIPRAERFGLKGLATCLGHLVRHPESRGMLRCAYIGQLHRHAMPVST